MSDTSKIAANDSWLDRTLTGVLEGIAIENISTHQPHITLQEAYDLQRQLVRRLQNHGGWGEVYGYKAALTAPQAQQAMGTDAPIIGVLFQHNAHEGNPKAPIKVDRQVLLETELGFTLRHTITAPVSSETVFDAVEACHGMIELAAPNLQQRPSCVDLIASNSSSYGCITSDWTVLPKNQDLDAQDVRLMHPLGDHNVLHNAKAGSVMQGQACALVWLINAVLAHGYALKAGHVLMTGSIGNMHSAKPGEYQAEFGDLGQLAFELA